MGLATAAVKITLAKALVDDIHQALLLSCFAGKRTPSGDSGMGAHVADWLSEVTGLTISRQRGWEILRQMTFRLRVPRPSHTESDPFEQEAWKKN